ncbi:MAG: PilX N-terminal domain-containing pilus assembly protein [Pseudomonadota bacterium]
MKLQNFQSPARQRGVALLMGLMMLLVLTLISVTAMQGSTMQERMAGNVRESNLAFQTAEDVVRQVEDQVRVSAETGTFAGILPLGWVDTGMGVYDCAGARFIAAPNQATWPQPADTYTDRGDMRYQVVEMSGVGGRSVACKPLEEEPVSGAGNRSSYYLIFGYSEGPASRASDLVVTTYYYED